MFFFRKFLCFVFLFFFNFSTSSPLNRQDLFLCRYYHNHCRVELEVQRHVFPKYLAFLIYLKRMLLGRLLGRHMWRFLNSISGIHPKGNWPNLHYNTRWQCVGGYVQICLPANGKTSNEMISFCFVCGE